MPPAAADSGDLTEGVTRALLQEHPSPAEAGKPHRPSYRSPGTRSRRRHSHPGVEVGFIIRGDVLMEFDHRPPLRLRTGAPFFIPQGAIHNARDVGTVTTLMISTYVVDEPLVATYQPVCGTPCTGRVDPRGLALP
ncbi:cupin domain-containing protein (plasmid) [Streptomyces sp. Q6]|uniref:Cupin domain-containing protein n=1 Tax=Streptomyces citrinus TaxID=3118173 RepID=A0ACD5AQP4_9ACTN